MNPQITRINFLQILAFFLSISCARQNMDRPLTVRLDKDPESLNPVTFKFISTRQIFDLIYQPLYAITLPEKEIKPILASSLSGLVETDSGFFMTISLQEKAFWDDRRPITSNDVAFTLKMLNLPGGAEIGINNQTDIFKDFIVNNPKSITFKYNYNVEDPHIVFDEFYIYPEHLFDPNFLFRQYTLRDIRENKDPGLTTSFLEKIRRFNFLENEKKICGSNAYKIKSWKPGEMVSLVKKDHYWFEELPFPEFAASPDTIIFQVIPNATSAIIALENHAIDVASNFSPQDAYYLREKFKDDAYYTFNEVETYDLTFFGSNGQKAPFNDNNFRKGLAWAMPYQSIFDHAIHRIGVPTIGFAFPHQENYYNSSISPRIFNMDSVLHYFSKAGWKLNAGNLLERNGQPAEFDLLYRKSIKDHELTAFLIQDSFKKVGIKVILHPLETSLLKEKLMTLDFDLFLQRISGGATAFDYEFILHTRSTPPNGWNFSSFGTQESDSLIYVIRDAYDANERRPAILRFQEILFDECNLVTLYNEKNVIIVNSKYENLNISSLTPGYTLATFKPKTR